ncbi:hypothetical protein AGMMS50222_10640 [Endomicrobiia bacterium]|nr:hypothetical protein AGMMS49556_08850 [Endomicrobiia bacterium]GHT77245.1 hypothetical protein AGMMS50222_10640 [Endomicrobiia bacterium]
MGVSEEFDEFGTGVETAVKVKAIEGTDEVGADFVGMVARDDTDKHATIGRIEKVGSREKF